VGRIRFALRGRERRNPIGRHAFAVDGQARQENEHERGVHTTDQKKTAKPDRDHEGARHQGVDEEKTSRGRRIPTQEQDENRVREERGDPQRRVVELAENIDVVRHRAQTSPEANEHCRGERLGRRLESPGSCHDRRGRYPREKNRDRQESSGEEERRDFVQEKEKRPFGGHGPVAMWCILANQVRAIDRKITGSDRYI